MYHKTDPHTIQEMFSSIAPYYDRANAICSLGLYKRWNRQLVEALHGAECLLDLCAGTGEIALGFLQHNPQARATLLDFSPHMLAIAQEKGALYHARFTILQGDAQEVPLPSSSVDAISIAYGIRNIADPTRCFQEARRLLIPTGRLGILELTRPNSWPLRKAHALYTSYLLPWIGKYCADNPQAYSYLANSVQSFSPPTIIVDQLQQAGFAKVDYKYLLGGIATLFVAQPLE